MTRQQVKSMPRKKLLAPRIEEEVVKRCRGRKRKVRGNNSDEDYEAVSLGNESNVGELCNDSEEVTTKDYEQN